MDACSAIKSIIHGNKFVLGLYLSDLNDADLMRRPGPGCNTIAWQLGHVISSSADMLNSIRPGLGPVLPEGFAAGYTKETAGSDDPSQFLTKGEYLSLLETMWAAIEKAAELPPETFDQPAPEAYQQWFPTVGDLVIIVANHPLMHTGQIVPVRRLAGKPVLM